VFESVISLIRTVSVSLQQITCFLYSLKLCKVIHGNNEVRSSCPPVKGVQVYSSTQWWQRIAQLMGTEAQKHIPPTHSIYLCKLWTTLRAWFSAIRNFFLHHFHVVSKCCRTAAQLTNCYMYANYCYRAADI